MSPSFCMRPVRALRAAIASFACILIAPSGATAADARAECARLVAGAASLSGATELAASGSGGQSWKDLYGTCDARNTFAGKSLPLHAGRPLKCSSDPNRVDTVSRFHDGTILVRSKMGVDADGSPVVGGSGWPNDVQTWLTFDRTSETHFANAEEIRFMVVPLPVPGTQISFMRDTGIRKGDLAVVSVGGKCSFGVVGDAGPWFRFGEASIKTNEDLDNPQCATPGQHPCRRLVGGGSGRGIGRGVTYVVFPGTKPSPLLSQTINKVASEQGAKKLETFLNAHLRR